MAESVQDLSPELFRIVWNEDGSTKVLSHKDHSAQGLDSAVASDDLESKGLDISFTPMPTDQAFHTVSDVDIASQIVTEITYQETPSKPKRAEKRKLKNSSIKIKEENPDEYSLPKKEKNANYSRKRFSRNWFTIPVFSKWLEESNVPGYAFCNVCKKDLLPGKSELQKHATTTKHIKRMELIDNPSTSTIIQIERLIDLRSDTVTTPTPEMREAMRNAIVGDDGYREDPTVAELEDKIATLTGKEAALFVPSGTMANLIAVMAHCSSRGSLVIIGDQSHMHRASHGSFTEIASVSQRIVRNQPDGTFNLSELKDIFKAHGQHWPTTTLVCIENAHTMMGGRALPIDWLNKLGEMCSSADVSIHLDGARLVNASAAVGSSPSKLAKYCSSVTFCLNKGLGAPGGSLLCGTKDFIQRATVIRKSLGGVIHQGGILAAAGLYGLNNFVSRITKDHSFAKGIAKGICNMNSGSVNVDVDSVQTNVVMLVCDNVRVTPQQLCERLEIVRAEEELELNEKTIIKAQPIPPNIVRLMTHGDLLMDDIKAAIRKLSYVINEFESFFVYEYL